MSLKVGDRVKVTTAAFTEDHIGAVGTIAAMEDDATHIYVELDDFPDPLAGVFPHDGWAYLDSEVELVEEAAA